MYATPIVYPASIVPEKWRWLLAVNPMAGIVEINRYAFLGVGTISKTVVISGVLSGILLLLSGLLVFNRVQRTFIDTV